MPPASKPSKETVRFSVDLDLEQREFLRIFGEENKVKASSVMRALIARLEISEDFAAQVIDEIFPFEE